MRGRIAAACRRAGRDPAEVRLIAVSKTRPASDIERAAALGITDFGENRVQEAAAKLPALGTLVTAHLIGHLQRNKARAAVRLFPVIQSVDSVGLAARLSAVSARGVPPPGGGAIRILAQVDLAGEPSKFGFPEAALDRSLAEIAALPGLRLAGLMLMPPLEPDPDAARPWFARLRKLAARLVDAGLLPPAPELSMGMSRDYEAAIAEGATMVRVGTAIFGPRSG